MNKEFEIIYNQIMHSETCESAQSKSLEEVLSF